MRLCQRIARGLGQVLVLGWLAIVLSQPAWAQCAMCRESASYQRAEAIQALNLGIILLAIPPVAIMIGISLLTYRYRNSSVPHPSNPPKDVLK